MSEINVSHITDGSDLVVSSDGKYIVTGDGTFDDFMEAINIHLCAQFDSNRIDSSKYADVYLAAMQAALQQSISFELSRQKADKDADLIAAQILNINEDTKLKILQQSTEADRDANIIADTDVKQQQKLLIINQQVTENGKVRDIDSGISLKTRQEENLIIEASGLGSKAVAELNKNFGYNSTIDSEYRVVLGSKDDTGLIDSQKVLVDNQGTTEEKKQSDIDAKIDVMYTQSSADELIKGAQRIKIDTDSELVEKQKETEIAKESDVVSQTSVRDDQSGKDIEVKDAQVSKIEAEESLLIQKEVSELAQTDGVTASPESVLGKQIRLYNEQANGFLWNARAKWAKLQVDAAAVDTSQDSGKGIDGITGIGTLGATAYNSKDHIQAAKPSVNGEIDCGTACS